MLKISLGPDPVRGLYICPEKQGAMVIDSANLTWVFKFEPKLVPSPDWREREKNILLNCKNCRYVRLDWDETGFINCVARFEEIRSLCLFLLRFLSLSQWMCLSAFPPSCLFVCQSDIKSAVWRQEGWRHDFDLSHPLHGEERLESEFVKRKTDKPISFRLYSIIVQLWKKVQARTGTHTHKHTFSLSLFLR